MWLGYMEPQINLLQKEMAQAKLSSKHNPKENWKGYKV